MRIKEKLKKVNKTLLKKELIALSEEYYKKFKNHNITRSFYRKNTQYSNTFEYVFSSFGKFKNEVLKRFLEKDRCEIKEEKEMKVELKVKGMMCMHCVAHVKEALNKVEGVKDVDVSLENGLATVTLEKDIDKEVLISAVKEAGYEAQ